MSIEQLESAMCPHEFAQWFEFYRLEPWGFEMDDVRHGQLQSTIANVSGSLKKTLSPKDFMMGDIDKDADSSSKSSDNEINDKRSLMGWLDG